MKPFYSTAIAVMLSLACYSQTEQCTTPDETVIDPNSITKCSVEDVKKALEDINDKEVSVKYRKKRNRVNSNSMSSTKSVSAQQNTQLVSQIELKKDVLSSVHKIPFHLVEEIPLFKNCENVPLMKQSKCFEKQMSKHIINNFNYPQEALSNKIEGRILVQFTINEEGEVVDIRKKGPEGTEILKNEAVRLISKLPKFIAGKHNGNNVKVKYGLPITFKLPKS
ncbi:Energy transducer TonB [Tenacibaculum sp. 190130A14a]|uniref:Periplasmic protein TonB n=1 Tax=Tenacibaculum polynesiense TaxID=3137857 RepID=A0ABP1F6W5_9FLAO